MELVIFFSLFFIAAIAFGPVFGAEDRPDFKRPDRKARKMVDPLGLRSD